MPTHSLDRWPGRVAICINGAENPYKLKRIPHPSALRYFCACDPAWLVPACHAGRVCVDTTPRKGEEARRLRVTHKGKLRLLDADMLPPGETPEPYQRRHQLSDKRDFDDGDALLNELHALARARREEGRGIASGELEPFLDDLRAVLVHAGSRIAHASAAIYAQNRFAQQRLGTPKVWC